MCEADETAEVTVRVELFHNVAKDGRGHPLGFSGYEAGHPVVKVFEFPVEVIDSPPFMELAERAFVIGNGAPGLDPEKQRLAVAYSQRRLRSLSVGDLVRIADRYFVCAPVGFTTIDDHLPNDITREHPGEPGTWPWPEEGATEAGN